MDSKDLRNIAEAYTLTKADKTGNTPAWQNRDKVNPKTGEPIYTKADHLKKEELEATGIFTAEEIEKIIQSEGYQRNPEGSIKDRFKSRQTDPSKDGFTGIGNSIEDIMKQNAAMKKAAAKKTKKESVGSAVDKTLSATADVAKVAGKVATGGVKVASKVAKGAAKTAGHIVGAPIGVAKSLKKGFQGGTQSESVGSAIDKGLSAGADVAKVAGKVATGGVKVASKVAKGAAKTAATVVGTPIGVAKSLKKGFQGGTQAESLNSTQLKDISEILSQIASKQADVDEGLIGKAIQGVGKAVGGAENVATGAVKKTADAVGGVVKGTAGAAKKVVKTVGSAVSGATRKEELELTGKFTAEEINAILEAERSLADRLARKRKVYDKTVKKAMQFARDEGEASGHARYRMSSISREMDGIKDKMKKEG